MSLILHGYFRSSAAYRVRIALNLKGLDYDQVSVHLRSGEQSAPEFLALNPQGLVPALAHDGQIITQSPAILEYLDEVFPDTARLLPEAPAARARVRALASIVCCDVHPLDNLRVLTYLQGALGQDEAAMVTWYNHWIRLGFETLESLLADNPLTGEFCHGEMPGLADVCLIPQIFNAQRHDLDMKAYPTISRIGAACDSHDAFATAHPSRQPDAQ
jgi:maleylacetoacetate isomerase